MEIMEWLTCIELLDGETEGEDMRHDLSVKEENLNQVYMKIILLYEYMQAILT